jgi:hypothetical protein
LTLPLHQEGVNRDEPSGVGTPASVPLLTEDSQIGANLRVCADEENRTDFDQRS